MASYQDIDVRLAVAETKLDMLMKAIQVTRVEASGLFDEKGQPVMRKKVMSLLDIYKDIQAAGAEVVNPTPTVLES